VDYQIVNPITRETILLVDDDESLLRLHQLALKSKIDLEIRVALTGQAAIEQINNQRPALVILDLMMPDMSGVEICRWLRARSDFATIPIVMLTGLSDPAAHLAARQAGANDVWLKPIAPSELVARIGHLLNP
jgi:two-component system phosphate regulon response regulator PhoB